MNNNNVLIVAQAFNGGMSALLAQKAEWRVSYADLREHLDTELLSTVIPVYSAFYSANGTIPFSKKHMNLYVKYTVNEVQQQLSHYFSGGR